jgi:gliding motility-associated lipoprotein GldH
MKRFMKNIFRLAFAVTLLSFNGCTDKKAVIDQNTPVPDHSWTYANKFQYDVKIDDISVPYNLYMNLRVTADYKFMNLFVLVTQIGPDKKSTIKRYELTLADKSGEWLGEGSGNLYSYQLPFLTNYKFPLKGTYHFYIEQNMRENPLKEVNDVGLRVEKAQ